MQKDELKELLKENLTINVDVDYRYGEKILNVCVYFDDEFICDDDVTIDLY